MLRLRFLSIYMLLLGQVSVYADLKLNTLFKENMVLQRDQRVSVYGSETPGSHVTVAINGQTKSTEADDLGHWELKLDPMEKSFSPQQLVVTSDQCKQPVTIRDVLIGDVWLCCGQSNMERWFELYPLLKDRAKDINNPDIRSIVMKRNEASKPQESVLPKTPFRDAWQPAQEPWAMQLSPTAYYFAAKLRDDLNVPIGLIVSAVGGSQIQRWMPKDVVDGLNLDSESSSGAGTLYNSMIHPLRNFTIKGVIWYQGESNGRIPHSYYSLSQAHIKCWRRIWARNNPQLMEMPFMTVQIAPFETTVDGLASDAWAYIRDAQLKTLSLPNTGLVVTTDLGEYADIHPQDKQPVGERLALWAEKFDGRPIVTSGPLFAKAAVNGNTMNVYFTYADSGLQARRVTMSSKRNVWAKDDPDAYTVSADEVAGFTLCGPDKKFVPAKANIVGEHVEVWSEDVADPLAVRYGWSTFPLCNLYNKEGLPASPFRSDDFPVPDVQGRMIGTQWDGENSTLGHVLEFTGSTTETAWEPITKAGRKAYQAVTGQSNNIYYAYFKVTEPSFKSGKCQNVVLSIIYFDQGDGTIGIQYDSSDTTVTTVKENPGAWKWAGKLKLENTETWKKAEFAVTDAFFDGRCNGADIRLNSTESFVFSALYCRSK